MKYKSTNKICTFLTLLIASILMMLMPVTFATEEGAAEEEPINETPADEPSEPPPESSPESPPDEPSEPPPETTPKSPVGGSEDIITISPT